MLFIGPGDGEFTDAHEGYVAGRHRDGTYSNIWTDVLKCAGLTFTAYAPACECGWRGPARPATDAGHVACLRLWVHDHFERLGPVQQVAAVLGRPLQVDADFIS